MDTCVLIPDEFSLVLTLHPNPKNILEMNVALWSNKTLPSGTRFRPTHGSVKLDKLEVYSYLNEDDIRNDFGNEDTIQNIDGNDVRHCNWVRFLKTSSCFEEANMVGVKIKGEPEFLTVKTILPNEEIVAYLQQSEDTMKIPVQQTTKEHVDEASSIGIRPVKTEKDTIMPVSPVPFPGSRDLLTSPPSRDDDCKSSVSDSSPSSCDETSPGSSGTPETEQYSDPGHSPYYMSSYPQQMSPLNLSSPRTPSKSSYTSEMSSIFTSPMTSTTNSHSPMTSPYELSPPIMPRLDSTPSPEGRIRPKRNRERTWLPCDVCGKKFDRPSLLKRHVRTHTGEKPHACDVCGKAFSTSSSLNTHRRIHSGEKPHECGVCGKRFTASSNLYYHRMTHNKEKPHKCQLCSKSFPTPGDLRSHMYVHNGSWPFRCDICNRGFSKQTNMKNHMLLHTGDKPHECPKCQKKFALYCNLKTHLKTHEDDSQGRCVTCGRTFLRKPDATSDQCIDCVRAASPDSTQRIKRPVSDFSISKLTNNDDKHDGKTTPPSPRHVHDPRIHQFYNPLMLMTPPSSHYLSRDHQPIAYMPVFGLPSMEDHKGHRTSAVPVFNHSLSLAEIAYQSQMAQYKSEWTGLMAK